DTDDDETEQDLMELFNFHESTNKTDSSGLTSLPDYVQNAVEVLEKAHRFAHLTSGISSAHSSMDYSSYFTPATPDDRKLSIKWQNTLVQADKQEQLLMCVPGPGGTGKSQLIKALTKYFEVTNKKYFLRKLAPTSIASSEIDGLTIHSFLGPISYAKKKKTVRPGDAKVTRNWHHVHYIFIDEMSMVGLHLLSQIHKLLCIAKSKSTEPFGGINVVFFGDFIQYPPVLDKPLYRDMLAEKNNTRIKSKQKTELDTQYEVGRALWLQLNTVVQLTRQMRTDDPAFLEAQNRLRYGQCTTEDHKLLSTRVIGHQSCPVKSLDDIEWKEAPVLVFLNDLRTELNNLAVISTAREIGVVLVVCIAHDTFNAGSAVNEKLRKFISRLPDNKTKGLCGYLFLVIGMPLLLTDNLATELRLSNGTSASRSSLRASIKSEET
ncbi:unnamed protein product, partial [Didymodactylos carnosus]